MTQTIDYYNHHADAFYAVTVGVDMVELHDRFLNQLSRGALILDAGCGSGRDSKAFLDRGYRVSAFDGSPELAQTAGALIGQPVATRTFLEVDEVACYDGIWACASLLHLGEAQLPEALGRLWAALKTDGVFYVSFKLGDKERLSNGRHFTDATEARLLSWMDGFIDSATVDCWITSDRRPQNEKKWLNAILRKNINTRPTHDRG